MNFTNESRVLQGPWTTLVKGRGLGASTKDFNEAETHCIQKLFHFMDDLSVKSEAYYQFSKALCDVIIDVNNPNVLMFQRKELYPKLKAIIAQLQRIDNPEQYVLATSILFESFGKLGFDPYIWMNDGVCLVEDALLALDKLPTETQQECYIALQAYGNLFLGASHIGQLDKLTQGQTNYVLKAFEVAQGLKDIWYRGRGVAAFLTVLGMTGLESDVIHPCDHLKDLIGFLDGQLKNTVHLNNNPNEYAFSIALMINCAVLLNKPHYLNYKQDWLKVVGEIIGRLPTNLNVIFSNYVLSALHNMGMVERFTSDARRYLLTLYERLMMSEGDELDYMAYTYYVDIANKLNLTNVIPDTLPEKLFQNISTMYHFKEGVKPEYLTYRSGFMRVAYGLTAMSQMNNLASLFDQSLEASTSLIEGIILNHTENWPDQDGSFVKLMHALIDLSLAQRGVDAPQSIVDQNIAKHKKKQLSNVIKRGHPIRIHAYFPGMNSRRSYACLPKDLYQRGNKAVRSIFESAADILSHESDGFHFSQLFFEGEGVFERVADQWNTIGASMTVYNLALFEHLKASRPDIVIDSVGGESYGMIAAAIASGALSLEHGLKVANSTLGFMYQYAHENDFGTWHIVSLSGQSVQSTLQELQKLYPSKIDVFRWQTLSDDKEEVHVYVHASALGAIKNTVIQQAQGLVSWHEFKRPTIEIVHSPKLSPVRETIEHYWVQHNIVFSNPQVPIVANNGTGIASTAQAIKPLILDMVDVPMYSAQTFRAHGAMIPESSNAIVEFGFGQKTRPLIFEHKLRQRFFEYFGDYQKLNNIAKNIQVATTEKTLKKELYRV